MSTDNDNKPAQQVKKQRAKKNSRGRYKVVFKGRLLDGFSKQTVVDNIARLTKISEQKIQQKFFSGKAVIIRRAHDEAHAQKLQQLFTGAGLEVIILKDELPKAQVDKPQSLEKKPKRWKNSRIALISVIVLLILTGCGVYLWLQYHRQLEVPQQVSSIESSLANEPLIFLAYANYKRLISLKNYFVNDPGALAGIDSDFFDKLKKSAIVPEKTLSHVLVASYLRNQKTVTHIFLLGRFPVAAVKKFLHKYYQGKAVKGGDNRFRIALIEPSNCKPVAYKEVLIEPDRIIISTDGELDNMLEILAKTAEQQTDLSGWDNYRSDKLLALALFKPAQGSELTSGLMSVIAKDIAHKNPAVKSLFAGLGVQLLPAAGRVDIRLNSLDQKWLADMHTAFLQQIQALKKKSKGLNSVRTLLNKISMEQNKEQLAVNLLLDKELKSSIQLSVNDFIDTFFSVDTQQEKEPKALLAEKINDKPVQYRAQLDKNQLPSYKPQYDQFFKPIWQQGPFALSIEELLLENDQIVLQLRGKGQNIDNAGNKLARIRILAVEDEQGNNVMANAACHKTTALDDYFSYSGFAKRAFVKNKQITYHELELRKKIRLKKGLDFSTVRTLKAEIDLNLPTRTEIVSFAKPAMNKVISKYATRILFKPSADDVLNYIISGNEQRVLAVRALNKKHQYLSNASVSSMTNIFGAGRSVTQNVQGHIAFIEVVYASAVEHLVYPLSMSQFPPYAQDGEWKYPLEAVKLSSRANWNSLYQDYPSITLETQNSWYGKPQATWHDGPFNLGLYALKTNRHFGTSGRILLRTPVIDELRHNFSALEVVINNPLKNKPLKNEQAENGQSGFYLLEAKGYYMNSEFILDRNKPYMDTTINFKLPYKNEKKPLTAIEGEIIVHLPLSKHSSSFSDLNIGALWEDEGVKVRLVRLSNTIMGFEVSGSKERLLHISLLDKDNNRISMASIKHGFGSKQSEQILLNYQGVPVKALLTVSEGQQLRSYPFRLQLK